MKQNNYSILGLWCVAGDARRCGLLLVERWQVKLLSKAVNHLLEAIQGILLVT